MKRMITLVSVLLITYAVLVLLIFGIQDRLVYFPTRDLVATPRTIGIDYEDVWLTTEDGVRLHAWFIPTPGARLTVLHFHGNGGNISHRLERIKLFGALNLNVFLFDYRGYGQSGGRPNEEGMYRDARSAWGYLVKTRLLSPSSIVLHGESLGGAVAVQLASEQTPAAVIVESSFSSIKDLGAEVYPWLPVRWISRFDYSSKDRLTNVHSPILIVHSRDDELVPFHHGETLFAAAAEPKQFLEIHGSHNAGFTYSDKVYATGIAAFLTRMSR